MKLKDFAVRPRTILQAFVIAFVMLNGLPTISGLYYMTTGNHPYEQAWLDRNIGYLKVLKTRTDDPDLQEVLDYCIRRYHHIGAWDVAVMPLVSTPGDKSLGANWPLCPGFTLDYETLQLPLTEGSMVLVHESLHDWWPCFGHSQVTPRMEKLERLERPRDNYIY